MTRRADPEKPGVRVLDDTWAVITEGCSIACHWEHTMAITEVGSWVLTALNDAQLGPEEFE